jgi:low temperature requirement protein LtrA
LVKLVNDLKVYREQAQKIGVDGAFANQAWYEGGLWRSPRVLPQIETQKQSDERTRVRQAVSLSDLFFNLVVVTAFTRVGLAITRSGQVTVDSFLYFAVFWSIWSKEASYSTRFDTTDLSAKAETLVTCFAVLFASLSVSAPMDSDSAPRIMIAAAFCSLLHCGLMARVFCSFRGGSDNTVVSHVQRYAVFNTVMNFVEAFTWVFGLILCPAYYRWIIFTAGVLLGLRIPRAFMANDFHGEY